MRVNKFLFGGFGLWSYNLFKVIIEDMKMRIFIGSLVVFALAINFSFSADQDFNDRNWDDFNKIPQSLPAANQREYKPLPIPKQNEPKTIPAQNPNDQLQDRRFQDKYEFPNQNIDLNQRSLEAVDQQAQDRAVIANQKRWQQMMESNKANLFRRFDEWLEVFHIPKEYHLFVELFLVALFIIFFGVLFYRRSLKKQEPQKNTFRLPPGK